ncbi:MAG TPA: Ig-like domain-containing protein [Jatrophihabitantaceae bacterium]|nr:Ig-like domain-containing protein [Jatrophihabitantaceae bacterium]
MAGALAALAIAVAWVPGMVRAGTPGRDPANGSWVGGLVVPPGPEQLVLWKLPGTNGVLGTCIDAGRAGPLRGPYAPASTITDPVYGELNHLYSSAATSDVRLAELSALNSQKYDRVDKAVQWSYLRNGAGGTSVADAQAMLARAAALAGPYVVTITVPSGELEPNSRHDATVTVRASRGGAVPSAEVSLTASGATLERSTVTTNSSGRASVRFRVAATGSSTFVIRAGVHSWTSVRIYTAPGEQQMLAAGPPSLQQGSAFGHVQRERVVAFVKAADGDPTLTPHPGYTYRITDESGKVVIASVISGNAADDAPLGRLRLGVRYTATEIAAPDDGELYVPKQPSFRFTVPAGQGAWTLVARDPRKPTPAITTHVTEQIVRVGAALTDVVTITGNDGEDGTITATRYGPVPPPKTGRCSDVPLTTYLAAPSRSFVVPVDGSANDGNGDVRVDGGTVTVAGCYGWAELLRLVPSGAVASSPPTASDESTLVTAPSQVRPKLGRVVPLAPTPRPVPPVPAAPPLAATGSPIPVTATSAFGLGLILVGAIALAAGRRRPTD